MAWNEPGKPNQGPPDLDEALRKLSQKLSGVFGGKKSDSGTPNSGTPNISKGGGLLGLGLLVIILLLVWALTGIFIVSPAEKSVILRFGNYQRTVEPGPHWIPRLIESETTLNVQKISNYAYSAQMLTKDQNIVDVAVAVQYRIDNTKDYLYNVANPTLSLQQATASALRQVIGNTTLDEVLTTGRAVVRQEVNTQLNSILARYKAGIVITDVALQPARAPEQVKAAFDDAIKAQEDEQRYINQAEAYAMGVVPISQGKAKRIEQEANAYKEQIVLAAEGHIAHFKAILPIYRHAPGVTRERMYLDTLENILEHNPKVFVDTKSNSHNLMYLPLDKLLGKPLKMQQTVEDEDATSKSLAQTGSITAPRIPLRSTPSDNSGMQNRPQRFSVTNPDSLAR